MHINNIMLNIPEMQKQNVYIQNIKGKKLDKNSSKFFKNFYTKNN